MPKKRDGPETKKSRKSSSASKDAASSSPMGSDILPPPTPAASHLVASNPFDDTVPSNPMKMHNYPNQPMMRMSPAFPPWGPGPRSVMRPQYSAPGGPNWGTNMHSNPNMGPVPGYNPNMPSNGYGHYSGPGLPTMRGSTRIPLGNVRPGVGPMGSPDGDPMLHDPSMGPNHMVSSGNQGHMLQNTGQMKALTRPTAQMSSPNIRKTSTSSNKHLGDSKSPKASDSSMTKQRKKNEKKLSQENKSKSSENERPIGNDSAANNAPHAIPPKELPQTCPQCSKNIDYPVEDAIRCLASCNKWYHRTCVGLTENAYKFLKMEELAIWACDVCLRSKEIQSIRPRVPVVDGQIVNA